MKIIHFSFISLFAISIFSCNGDEDPTDRLSNGLISSDEVHTWFRGELKTFIGLSGLDIPTDDMQHNVTTYDVIYEIEYKGDIIKASGRVFIPSTTDTVSTVCFSRGTIALHSETFTELSPGHFSSISLSGLASLGFVVIAPDLIGFGASFDLTQTYYLEEPTATTTIGNIDAGLRLASTLKVNVDRDLYLAGYSQGGYSTMATHKYIEEKGITFFDLKASFPAAGGYDIASVQSEVFTNEIYNSPFYLGLVQILI